MHDSRFGLHDARLFCTDDDDNAEYRAKDPMPREDIVQQTRVSVPVWHQGRIVGWGNGTVVKVQPGDPTDPSDHDYYIVHVDNTQNETGYFGWSVGRPVVYPRYVVLFHDGIGGGGGMPEAPSLANTANTLREARELFGEIMRDSGNDYLRRDGYEAPFGDVTFSADYDGISYGDSYLFRYMRGPRGGVTRENF